MPTAALAPAAALAGAGFRRWSTYRQAAVAGVFVNTVFGVIRLSILLGVAESAGGEVAGYDAASLSTYTWVAQGMIAVVMIFTWTELADRVRTGDVAVDLARPVDLQLAWLAQDLGRAGWALISRGILPIAFGAAVYGIYVPGDVTAILLFPVSMLLAVVVSFACRFIVNLSVWRSIDELWAFAYASTHKELFRRRFEWFERSATPTMVLWWQPGGTVPDIHDALGRLRRLTELGPTAEAFTFKQRFPAPDHD